MVTLDSGETLEKKNTSLSREPVLFSKNDHKHRLVAKSLPFRKDCLQGGHVREGLTGEAACQVCQVAELQGQRDGVRAARERSCQTAGCREKPQSL